MFHTYTLTQLETLVDSVGFNQLERKELRQLCKEMAVRLRNFREA